MITVIGATGALVVLAMKTSTGSINNALVLSTLIGAGTQCASLMWHRYSATVVAVAIGVILVATQTDVTNGTFSDEAQNLVLIVLAFFAAAYGVSIKCES